MAARRGCGPLPALGAPGPARANALSPAAGPPTPVSRPPPPTTPLSPLGAQPALALAPARPLAARASSSSAVVASSPSLPGQYSTVDALQDEARLPPGGGADKRAFTYFVIGSARFLYASAARLAVINVVGTLSASADVLALAAVEVDLGNIAPGATVTVKWRGKPVFIKRRTPEMIADVATTSLTDMRDPQTDAERTQRPEWLIVLGVCTHLGCVPMPNAGDYGGWYCPCHGSHYDGSGRIRRGPAPLNLEVPSYKFLSDSRIVLG